MPDSAKIMRFYSIFCRVSCQTQNFNNIFLKKSHFHGKSSLNSALKSGKFGSNPFHHPENAIGIFWFRVFFDFQKSEKNGEKRRKPEKIPGFSRGIYFDPKTWLRRKDLNQRPSGYEPDELPDCSTPRYIMVPETGLEPVRDFRLTGF